MSRCWAGGPTTTRARLCRLGPRPNSVSPTPMAQSSVRTRAPRLFHDIAVLMGVFLVSIAPTPPYLGVPLGSNLLRNVVMTRQTMLSTSGVHARDLRHV